MNGETALYVWGSFFMVLAMLATEVVLLLLREFAIRGQFGPGHEESAPTADRDTPAQPLTSVER